MSVYKMESFTSKLTAYYPTANATETAENRLEGGPLDRRGVPLITLQDYLEGGHDYVSIAMDLGIYPYGTKLCIPDIERRYHRSIEFRVVDTGDAFRGQGRGRIDVCVRDKMASYDEAVNRLVAVVALIEAKG